MFYDGRMKNGLEKAIEHCGGQTALAKCIGVRQPNIWNWLNRAKGIVPAEFCLKIEKATNSSVTRYELRPDVFGEVPQEEAA